MAQFKHDHVHLRSPDPESTAQYYEKMFGAEVIRSTQADGSARVDLNLGGLSLFIAPVRDGQAAPAPSSPYLGLVRIAFLRGPQNVSIELVDRGAA